DEPDVVKGIAGSFYAVRDYFDVSPDYAINAANRLAEFDALVERVHRAGMKALIDFVPNHVARGYQSVVRPEINFGEGDDKSKFFSPNNHLFYLVDPPGQRLELARPPHWHPPGLTFSGLYAREDGAPGRVPKVTGNNAATSRPSAFDWYETIKINYGYNFIDQTGHYTPRPRTWDLMDQILAYWQSRGVDGFRCDFAHYVPAEAWAHLLGQARSRDSDAYFFAEAYPYAGSGDPVTDMQALVDVGFDAVYHDNSYNHLKRIYQSTGSQDDYNDAMVSVPAAQRAHYVEYLENHDERRVASPVVQGVGQGESGFGTMKAGYLLAPLQYLYGSGPVLLLNGQEVGEPGDGFEGYGGEDGRTTLFDYWSMPAFVKWVNNHRFDGGQLSEAQKSLRVFYEGLLRLCQDPSVRGSEYWGLKYFNRLEAYGDCPASLYTFARYHPQSGRMLVVAGNFDRANEASGQIRLPSELIAAAGMAERCAIKLSLDHNGIHERAIGVATSESLEKDGFEVTVLAETCHVYVLETA
ncbi:MAG TPA: alpha-amylase family glycosyl hydrolase, partial [Tepidisphaeraceae bacterium]